jgi:acyl-CoA synthetase (AMP-forming)/AMP-acid ligase II
VGEIYSHTPWCFDGYWKLPDKTAEAFDGIHLSVGDMARRDEDGYYYLVDRKKNMIISGGLNIYPSEVENVLAAHADVMDVAVIGRTDAKWGESVHGVVVLRDGSQNDRAADDRLVQRQDRALQTPSLGRVHPRRGHAADHDGQDFASCATRSRGPQELTPAGAVNPS